MLKFLNSNNSCVDILGLFYYKSISSVNNNSINFLFEFLNLSVTFSCVIILARMARAMLNRSNASRQLCLAFALKGKVFNILPLTSICQDTFIRFLSLCFYSVFTKISTMNGCWTLSNAFSEFKKMIMWKLHTFLDVHEGKRSKHHRDNRSNLWGRGLGLRMNIKRKFRITSKVYIFSHHKCILII